MTNVPDAPDSVPHTGEGADSALDALIRKRIPVPGDPLADHGATPPGDPKTAE